MRSGRGARRGLPSGPHPIPATGVGAIPRRCVGRGTSKAFRVRTRRLLPGSRRQAGVLGAAEENSGRTGFRGRSSQRRRELRRQARRGRSRTRRCRFRQEAPLLPQPDGPARHVARAEERLDGHGLHRRLRRRGRRLNGQGLARQVAADRRALRARHAPRHHPRCPDPRNRQARRAQDRGHFAAGPGLHREGGKRDDRRPCHQRPAAHAPLFPGDGARERRPRCHAGRQGRDAIEFGRCPPEAAKS